MPDGRPVFLPYGRQSIDESDLAAVAAAMRADFLTTGPLVDRFEQAFAEAVDAPFAVACGNGTQALHLAVAALDIGPGEVCIVPSITFVATANVCAMMGAEVAFADVDPATGLMTDETLADALARAPGEVRAILPVHLTGNACDMPRLRAMADRWGCSIVEDACHAVGTETAWGKVGSASQSDAACFSFHPVKTITTGEGGMVTTRDVALWARMRRLRSHGVVREGFENPPGTWWYEQTELGWNYRLPDLNCALGLSQLKRLPEFAAQRRKLAARYAERLAALAPVIQLPPVTAGVDPALHLLAARIDFAAAGTTRAELMEALRRRGIGSQVHYIPVHRQPFWSERSRTPTLPGADAWYEKTLSLPLYPAMTEADVDRVADVLAETLSGEVLAA